MSFTVAAEYLEGPGDGQRHTVPVDEFGRPPAERRVVVSSGVRAVLQGQPTRLGRYALVCDPVTHQVVREGDGSVRYVWSGWLPD